MTKYLLVAEADRIQDLIFRSSQLREVVGGSQLLTRFGEEVLAPLATGLGLTLGTDVQVITAGGGSFYLDFVDEVAAHRFGAALAEVYYRATGGTLSVIDPVAYEEGEYTQASERAGIRLRMVKRRGPAVAVPQIPYIAFCESCGVGLAEAHEQHFADADNVGQYLCPACRVKAAEREQKNLKQFLGPFYDAVFTTPNLPWPETWPKSADEVGELDPRRYVAYIVADGNNIGNIFSNCTKDQAHALSEEMETVTRAALAEPLQALACNRIAAQSPTFVPALPLILGGDDIFALVPARWACDIARRFCLNFQKQMTDFAHAQSILNADQAITMTAVVVICKANYPYYLAHQIGDARLGQAKRVVKALARDEQKYVSAVDFEVVLGSQVQPALGASEAARRPTVRPYWVIDDATSLPTEWGLSLTTLLKQRLDLAAINLPARRRSQLRELFDQVGQGDPDGWNQALVRFLGRVERDRRWQDRHPLRLALESLGGVALDSWQEMTRTSDQKSWQGHGMGDLLRIWEWALQVDVDPQRYEGGLA